MAASGWLTRSPEPSRRPTGGGSSTGVPAAVAPRAGPGPARGATEAGTPVELPPPVGRRDGSGEPVKHPLAAIGGTI